eukprot:2816669-Karenia_brevis.AAC.1
MTVGVLNAMNALRCHQENIVKAQIKLPHRDALPKKHFWTHDVLDQSAGDCTSVQHAPKLLLMTSLSARALLG